MGADLQDRALGVRLASRETYDGEGALWARWSERSSRMIGALLCAAARARAELAGVEREHGARLAVARMRDAAGAYTAAARVLGLDEVAALDRLVSARAEAQALEVESDVVGQAVLALAERSRLARDWAGVLWSGELAAFELALRGNDRLPDGWPKNLRWVRARLDRLAAGLRVRGLAVEITRSSDHRHVSAVALRELREDAPPPVVVEREPGSDDY